MLLCYDKSQQYADNELHAPERGMSHDCYRVSDRRCANMLLITQVNHFTGSV